MVALTKCGILALRGKIVKVAHEHGAAEIHLFGSVARDEADATSDVDFLVTPAAVTPPFFPGGLIGALEDLLSCPVQITLDSLRMSARLRHAIEREVVAL